MSEAPSEAEKKQPAKKTDPKVLRRAIGLFSPYKKDVVVLIVLIVLAVIAGIAPPFLYKLIIDEGITKHNWNATLNYSMLALLAVLAVAGLTLLYGWRGVLIGQKMICDLRESLC